jgi:hypothetical protein
MTTYSMEGFTLRLVDGIIELHTDGEQGPGTEDAHARAFSAIADKLHSRLVMYDIRSASFVLSDIERAERTRFVARIATGYRIAYVVRPDQMEAAEEFVTAHRRLGDAAACFTSKSKARDWLKADA